MRPRPKFRSMPFLVLAMLTTASEGFAQLQPFPVRENSQIIQFQQYNQRSQSFSHRRGVPDWSNGTEFPHDVFTFVRVQYGSSGSWRTDYPDSDLNFTYRLQQLTSIKVDPSPITLRITDPRLFDHPFLYFCEPGGRGGGSRWGGGLDLSPEEARILRRYFDNGGFALFDDFWGEGEWDTFYRDIKKVFPDREYQDLPLEHPIFHTVFDLKERPQIPAIDYGVAGRGRGPNGTNVSWERSDATQVHYRAFFDDKGRMVCCICHNTDLGDGWEEEGVDEWYFHEYSEKKSYPMGVNIVFYALTH